MVASRLIVHCKHFRVRFISAVNNRQNVARCRCYDSSAYWCCVSFIWSEYHVDGSSRNLAQPFVCDKSLATHSEMSILQWVEVGHCPLTTAAAVGVDRKLAILHVQSVIILLLIPDRILHANLFLFVVLFVQFPDRVPCGKLSSLSISF